MTTRLDRRSSASAWGMTVSMLLSACSVGPRYTQAPSVAHEQKFLRAEPRYLGAEPVIANWWAVFGDLELSRLIGLALSQSPDVEAAAARLSKARMIARLERAGEFPKLSATAAALRSNASLNSGGSSSSSGPGSGGLDFYFTGFDASWELDFFGKSRSMLKAARARDEIADAEIENVRVSLAAEVGRKYIELRAHQLDLALLQRICELEHAALDLVGQRRARGVASELDLERARSRAETAAALAIPVRQELQESLDGIAVLTGEAPGTLDAELAQPRPLPELPDRVDTGDVAAMLRRRPDIRAAEREIAARTAMVDVRTAELFPSASLLGSIGYGSNSIGGLVNDASSIYLAAPVLRWDFLDFGANRARLGQSMADRDESVAIYKGVVLRALQDAESSLSRFGAQRSATFSLERIKSSADRETELALQRRRAGTLSELGLLDAKREQLDAERNLLESRAILAERFIGLQKSLGLGWQRDGSSN
jgi:NodT family efflux transporter outer membrane factor (OMF) lipoprotein